MTQKINFRNLETIDACNSIHELKQEKEDHTSIKELLLLEEIYS